MRVDGAVCLVLQVMMATGRVPKIQGLGLEQVGVQLGETGALPLFLGASHRAAPSVLRLPCLAAASCCSPITLAQPNRSGLG